MGALAIVGLVAFGLVWLLVDMRLFVKAHSAQRIADYYERELVSTEAALDAEREQYSADAKLAGTRLRECDDRLKQFKQLDEAFSREKAYSTRIALELADARAHIDKITTDAAQNGADLSASSWLTSATARQ